MQNFKITGKMSRSTRRTFRNEYHLHNIVKNGSCTAQLKFEFPISVLPKATFDHRVGGSIPVGCVPVAHWPYADVCFLGGGRIWSPSISPLDVGLDLIPLNFPLGCGPGSDPPQFPPWVWAWIWSPSISPLDVGLDLIPLNFPLGVGLDLIPLNFPLGCGPGGGVPPSWGSPSRGLLLGGSPWEGVSLAGGFSFLGGCCYPSMHWGRPPPVWTEWQTGVKILPWAQLRCGW